ncbi:MULTISPECIES: IS110 family transposase [unclassified Bradyrhizobium]|uniref:IS110 family transposase n=1 Tax=unclassified Bradyrhizobium TaxID=2631580 RepID=UPI00211EABD6|nr:MULTISPECIES: IS110 family transposase [unclassified Bradyrhizobium]MDD1537935.1 IS110 family transposase [Bradyrhizobium sp. WBOS8]MDD1587417.1 IS110 family transposase [Bradyrhizobium sp. WBOS4]UUO51014.1 IS110 family transposase [Bradyrhizobium sp. WBOS04]UUO63256.1 IS110 family transposase [Bradyrhizobium sp. WBOS08]
MQASTATLTTDHNGTIFVAIELSQKTWLVTLHSPDRDRMSRHKLDGGDHAGLLELIEKIRRRAADKLGSVPRVVSCYEAGYDGFWLHRLLEAAGIMNLVFDPASIAVEQRSRRTKTDRIDGELLLRTLMAHLRGEPRVVRIVRVPSVAQEDARRSGRERDRLVKEQTAHTNRIKALLRLAGMAVGYPRRSNWLDWLAKQRDWQGQPLSPHLLAEVTREHARLMLVRKQLVALERAQATGACTVPEQTAERQERLERLKALGPALSGTLTHEVFYKDFHNRRQVGSYVGLAPSPWQSGGIDREQGISKAGNPRARVKAIELAWLWLRHQPDSELSLWFRTRTANAGKRARRIAIVALARKLIVALWRYLTTGLVPAGATMKA